MSYPRPSTRWIPAPGALAVAVALLAPETALTQDASIPEADPVEEAALAPWLEVPIEPGDMLELRVWRMPDYSGEFRVDARGRAVLPLVGDWEVAGELPTDLTQRLVVAYSRTLRDPVVSLEVLRRVRVLGEVTQPGVFYLDGTMTVADALARAGGRTPSARGGEVILRRGGEVIESDVRVETRLAELPVRSGDELLVPQRGWMGRNAAAVISGVAGLLGVAIAVFAQ